MSLFLANDGTKATINVVAGIDSGFKAARSSGQSYKRLSPE